MSAFVRAVAVAAVVVVVVPVVVGACATLGSARDDLQQATALHHIDLRWGRLENAAARVAPAARAAFLAEWVKASGVVELQDMDVSGIVIDEDGNGADVVVTVTYVERDTMSVRSAVVTERWLRVDGAWLCTTPATLSTAMTPGA
jgi:hypothetical protein